MIEFAGKGELYKQLHRCTTFSEKRSSRVSPFPLFLSPLADDDGSTLLK